MDGRSHSDGAMDTPLSTAIDYLKAEPHTHGYRYFDDASGRHWSNYSADLAKLGQYLIEFREADEAGEIDPEATGCHSENDVYSVWCSKTDSVEA